MCASVRRDAQEYSRTTLAAFPQQDAPPIRKGYVMEHRLVMEKHLGRFLTPEEVVHHVDEDGGNNAIENLRVMSKTEHDALHSQSRVGRPRTAKQTAPAV